MSIEGAAGDDRGGIVAYRDLTDPSLRLKARVSIPGSGQSKDPLIGTQDPTESIFVIPQADGAPPIRITDFSSFITTKAAAYCFLPSVTAIGFIAGLGRAS